VAGIEGMALDIRIDMRKWILVMMDNEGLRVRVMGFGVCIHDRSSPLKLVEVPINFV
jgi:hypothetical protein